MFLLLAQEVKVALVCLSEIDQIDLSLTLLGIAVVVRRPVGQFRATELVSGSQLSFYSL